MTFLKLNYFIKGHLPPTPSSPVCRDNGRKGNLPEIRSRREPESECLVPSAEPIDENCSETPASSKRGKKRKATSPEVEMTPKTPIKVKSAPNVM